MFVVERDRALPKTSSKHVCYCEIKKLSSLTSSICLFEQRLGSSNSFHFSFLSICSKGKVFRGNQEMFILVQRALLWRKSDFSFSFSLYLFYMKIKSINRVCVTFQCNFFLFVPQLGIFLYCEHIHNTFYSISRQLAFASSISILLPTKYNIAQTPKFTRQWLHPCANRDEISFFTKKKRKKMDKTSSS